MERGGAIMGPVQFLIDVGADPSDLRSPTEILRPPSPIPRPGDRDQ